MHGISQFYDTFFDKSPFKNVEKPTKPKISDAERTGISDKEHHAISSNTDANSVMITVDKEGNRVEPKKKDAATKMSALHADEKKVDSSITKPSYTGGYVGGGDIAGGYYVSTADMYDKIGETMNKIGQTVGDAIEKKKKDKLGPDVGGQVSDEEETTESKNK
tara:strand:+ start:495 stop:983 length:489 start_codon:yes stop_codon:yes gene_type:complete